MATAPVKPQPLHNFPLSLKWGQTATAAANHRHPTPEPDETESDDHEQPTTRPRVGSRSARLHRVSFSSCSTAAATLLKNSIPADAQKQKAPVLEADGGEEDGNLRPWRLRPRRGILAQPNEQKEREKENDAAHHKHHHHHQAQQQQQPQQVQQPKSMRLRGLAESSAATAGGGAAGGGAGDEKMKKKEKSKVWISLSRDEIEEDIFIMTGSRPSRRPRKRPKSIQKVLDNVFPGLWLVGASADSYRVVDTPIKR